MSSHTLLNAILWTLSGLFVLEQLVSMTRTKAPKRNRRLAAPSVNCERTGSFDVHKCALTRRQAS